MARVGFRRLSQTNTCHVSEKRSDCETHSKVVLQNCKKLEIRDPVKSYTESYTKSSRSQNLTPNLTQNLTNLTQNLIVSSATTTTTIIRLLHDRTDHTVSLLCTMYASVFTSPVVYSVFVSLQRVTQALSWRRKAESPTSFSA